MSFDDLDLEFEDEEESKKKKPDAIHTDVDLEFQAPHGGERPRPQPVSEVSQVSTPSIKRPAPENKPVAVIKKLDDARAPAPGARPGGIQPRVAGANALKLDSHSELEAEEILQLREHTRKVEFDAAVKVAIAEFKMEIMSELLGDMKLLEHQVGQLLVRINAKHPDMKQEALMIKKILADFTAKKRK